MDFVRLGGADPAPQWVLLAFQASSQLGMMLEKVDGSLRDFTPERVHQLCTRVVHRSALDSPTYYPHLSLPPATKRTGGTTRCARLPIACAAAVHTCDPLFCACDSFAARIVESVQGSATPEVNTTAPYSVLCCVTPPIGSSQSPSLPTERFGVRCCEDFVIA